MTGTASLPKMKERKARFAGKGKLLWLIPLAFLVALAIWGTVSYIRDYNAPIPLTDLPATYTGEIKDSEGNLLVPFDVAYPEAFATGEHKYREDALLLKMRAGFGGRLTHNLEKCGFSDITLSVSTANGDWYEAKIAEGEDITTVIQRARSLREVLMADYDYILTAEEVSVVEGINGKVHKNPKVNEQWHLKSAGIQDAWKEMEKNGMEPGGLSSTVVAVIDTGVDYTHPDLIANMWYNPGEIPDNGRDDDGNGYIDDYYGWDAVKGKGSGMDVHGHGTHVAGIIAASNNKEGVVGIAYNARIMPIAAGQATGIFLQNDIAEAILYAYEMGAEVINMSFGGSACSIAVQDALMTAYTRATLVASAGNNGMPNEPTDFYPIPLPNYPAALSYVIGVMSVNRQGVESGFSNWDVIAFNSVEYEVYAPGEDIYSTLAGGGYGKLSGTSMAAPVVSGIAALLRSHFTDRDMYPSKFIAAQICATSEDPAICCDPEMHGSHNLPNIVNAYTSLTKLPKPDVSLYDYYIFDGKALSEKNNGDGVADAGETLDIVVVLRNRWGMSKDTVVTIDSLSNLGVLNPYVEILIPEVDYEGVGTYSTKSTLVYNEENIITGYANPLRVKVSEDCPNDYRIGLNVTVSCGNALDEKDKATYTNVSGYGISFDVRAGVILPSQITEDMTLTPENLYIIPNSTYIAKGVTVRALPGTRIQFWSDDPNDPYALTYIPYLNVEGAFICEGTTEEPVELFPSDLMAQYRVEIKRTGAGRVDLDYTTVTNPYLDINTADHCTFRQNYSLRLLYRYLSDGKVARSDSSAYLKATTVTNSMIYKCGSAYSTYSYASWSAMSLSGTFDTCAFVDSMVNFSYQTYENCVFLGNYATNEGGSIGVSSLAESLGKLPTVRSINRNPATGTTYIIFEGDLKYARSIAQGLGGDLMCIETEDELQYVHTPDGNACAVGIENGATTWVNGEPIGDFITLNRGGTSMYAALQYGGGFAFRLSSRSYYCVEIPGSIYCDSILLPEYGVEIDTSSTYQLAPTVVPATFDVENLLYVSEDPAVASVSESGLITPHKEGETRIFVYAPDYGTAAVLSLSVVPRRALTGITVEEELVLQKGETLLITPALTPANTTEFMLTYASSAPEILSVDARGMLTANSVGTAAVTVSGANGITAEIAVTVISPVSGISFTDKFYVTYAGDTDTSWLPTVTPADASDVTIEYISSNPEVAYVDEEGNLVRVGEGNTTLRATVAGGAYYADLNICITNPEEFTKSKVVTIEGIWHVLAVTEEGSLWLWGGNQHRFPIKIAEGIRDVAIDINSSRAFVLREDGTVEQGAVSTGEYKKLSDQSYVSALSGVAELVQSNNIIYALCADGSVWSWPINESGSLDYRPVQLSIIDVVKVAGSDASNLFLTKNGTVYFHKDFSSAPQVIATGAVDVRGEGYGGFSIYELQGGTQYYVSATGAAYALDSNYTWYTASVGYRNGQIYWDNKSSITTPSTPSFALPNIANVFSCSYNLVYFVTEDGNFYGVGRNEAYQLADLTKTSRTTPTRIFLGLTMPENAPAIKNNSLVEGKLTTDRLVLDFDMSLHTSKEYSYIQLLDSTGKAFAIEKSLVLNKLTLAPLAGWVAGESYTLILPANAFINAVGVANEEIILNFTYENTTPIAEISASLQDGDILTDTAFSAVFGYSYARDGANFAGITLAKDGAAVEGITVTLKDSVLTLSGTLAYGDYTLTLPAGALCDNVGGESGEKTLSFRIVPAVTLTGGSVADGDSRADAEADITLNFTDCTVGTAFGGISLVGTAGAVELQATLSGGTLTLAHAPLSAGESYTLTLPENALVNAAGIGNTETVIGFTVYAAPAIVHASPAAGNQNVALAPRFTFIYNHASYTLDAEKLTLTAADGTAVSLTALKEGAKLTLNAEGLAPNTVYTLTLAEGAMTDEKGAMSPAVSYTLATVAVEEHFYWDEENIADARDEWIEEGRNNPGFTGNAILNNFQDTNVEHWLRIQAGDYQSDDSYMKSIGLAGNWWGTVNEEIIGRQVIDFDDYQSLADINYKNYLTSAPENTFPFVTAAYLLNADGERVSTVSNETVTCVVEFNRDMDTTVPLRVRFGSSMPYAEYEIAGEYVTARRWEGTYTLKTTIENGRQRINIENGRAADDHYLVLMETDSCRFGFDINTTGAQAMMMQGSATETGIQLSWMQDDFATLAGYNVYRATKEDGLYVRLNQFIIPADVTTFFDTTVEPGVRYYYNFTVVGTDFTESTPSGKINLMSMDTMAPGIYHSPVRNAFTNSNLIIGATVTDNLLLAEVRLFYRVKGEDSYRSAAMTNLNDRYSAVVSADILTTKGLEYYIRAYDGINYTYAGTADAPYSVTVQLAVDASAKGDVNGDGVITNLDALMLLQAANDLLNLTAEQFARADLNDDGELSAAEALRILQYVNGKITTVLG